MPVRFARRRNLHQFPPAESILGPAPLFEGEDRKGYEALLKNVRAAINPPNFLVELSIREVVYCTWLIARYQREEIELSKKIEDSEKVYHADRFTELSIKMEQMREVQEMIASAQWQRLKAYKEIQFICTKFAKALRKAMAEAEAELVEPGNGDPATQPAA